VSQDRPDVAAFLTWLDERIMASGLSRERVALEAGFSSAAVYAIFYRGGRVTEATARKLAAFFGDDSNRVAALAGYDPIAAGDVARPSTFPSFGDWLRAFCRSRGMAVGQVSVAIGLARNTLGELLRRDAAPSRPTLLKLAAFAGIDPAELLHWRAKWRPKQAGPTWLARLAKGDPERHAAITAKGLAAAAAMPLEQRQANWRRAGAISMNSRTPEQRRAMQDAGRRQRKTLATERGSWYRSDETRAQYVERMRATGPGRSEKAIQTKYDRYGRDVFKKQGKRVIENLSPSDRARKAWVLRCGRAIRRLNLPVVDPDYQAAELHRARVALAELRRDFKPSFKKPTTWLADLDLAQLAVALKVAGRSYTQIADELFGETDESTTRRVREAVQRGKVLRLVPLAPPRRGATQRIVSIPPRPAGRRSGHLKGRT
jgi:transcriptional regulator with XRE-family HTH domain